MSSNNKMKGLLKGLRYISQIFENEKESEMQIGLPTDVKHVAHIGWDGPSVNSAPSWMNEFKSPQGFSSEPLANAGVREEDPVKWVSQDGSNRKGSRRQSSSSRDMPELPKSSRRSSSTNGNGTGESSMKEKPDKPRQSRKPSNNSSSKDTSDGIAKPKKSKDANQATDSASQDLPGIPKKSGRRKKSKDRDSVEGSSRRSRTQDLDNGSESGSVSRGRGEQLSNASAFEEEEDNSREN
ncbi:CRIB domain-containing protein RIC6-like [Durio zibethinus]|uniref:CRIB domain-containing protein RIC6-like n=1 Tax=Durio zibethinus TaxID=66656 RepID=A0A6P5XH38_DURZI|nr:CRIB domain-containing protein RIC6-like [Durio zibethinus]